MASSPISSGSPASSTSSTPVPARTRPSVQALLAELSDSDSDSIPTRKSPISKPVPKKDTRESPGEESSEDDLLVGGGRLARRLAGGDNARTKAVGDERAQPHAGGSSSTQRRENVSHDAAQVSEDEAATQPKRRFLLKRKRTMDEDEEMEEQTPQSPSPSHGRTFDLQRKSPTLSRPTTAITRSPRIEATPHENEFTAATGQSRFQTLVEKARKEREAREKAEQTKKLERAAKTEMAAPQKRRPRGSSPADDSEEGSDHSDTAAARRLTKEARPTRKASKKALEEMNRETQRMTRNMQLAHQARTKKKFTKEGFFASFNASLPVVAETIDSRQLPEALNSLPSSSDPENTRLHSTPPTSPLRPPALNKTMKPSITDTVAMASGGLQEDLEDMDSFEDIFASRRTEIDNTGMTIKKGVLTKPRQKETKSTTTVRPTHRLDPHDVTESDSDIEVVFDAGHRRKYAAFENLPKKKAKEMPSHLALRSLAQVRQGKDKKSTMSGAEVGPSLFRAARKQALDERREKIEKLRAAGVVIQTTEEKEKDEEALENLVERARQEDEEIRKREKELAKKDGTYVKDALDDDDSDDDEDEDFQDEDQDEDVQSGSDHEDIADDEEEAGRNGLIDSAAEESAEETTSDDEVESTVSQMDGIEEPLSTHTPVPSRVIRKARVVLDDEEEEDMQQVVQSPALPTSRKTPQTVLRSTRKIIPGLQHSDDLPIGLTQAFAATMAESQTQGNEPTQEQDSLSILRDLPSPFVDMMPRVNRVDSFDIISQSLPGTQTQPFGLDFGLSQSQRVPESPAVSRQMTASQADFDLTQDAGYSFSPFAGNRFAETPKRAPHSTEETIVVPVDENSPMVQKRGRLLRGRQTSQEAEDDHEIPAQKSAFEHMSKAAKRKMLIDFNKKQSEARRAVDEAAEESDDEYAGLGGASDDDSNDEENEDDRRMIDEDTEVGKGDASKLAKLYADREREADEAAVNKMMKDITTGGLRRKRGAGDDLDLSDEEDATTRRREAKRREFAKMRRELLKDEAVGKIAEDKKKQAFLKSIEDHEGDDEDEDFDQPETPIDPESQERSQQVQTQQSDNKAEAPVKILLPTADSQLNQLRSDVRRTKAAASRKPGTLAEIRESVSFLIEEPDSQAGILDLGLSDSEDEPEAYVNLDRHFRQAEADEDAMNDENEDLGGFIVDDEDKSDEERDATFKKPELPSKERDRAPFSERRTKSINVVDRLSLLQASTSSTAGSNASSKMAFFSSKAGSGSFSNVPSLLRRATTNSGLGSMSGRENVSATGVITNKTERGSAAAEKDFVRKGASTSRNAVNYQGRQNLKEEKMSARAGIVKKQQKKKGGGFLGGLFRGDSWA